MTDKDQTHASDIQPLLVAILQSLESQTSFLQSISENLETQSPSENLETAKLIGKDIHADLSNINEKLETITENISDLNSTTAVLSSAVSDLEDLFDIGGRFYDLLDKVNNNLEWRNNS